MARIDVTRFHVAPQCSNWQQGETRCQERAAVYIFAPDGQPVPGGYLCWDHGQDTIDEYAEKLGEVWTLRPLTIEES